MMLLMVENLPGLQKVRGSVGDLEVNSRSFPVCPLSLVTHLKFLHILS